MASEDVGRFSTTQKVTPSTLTKQNFAFWKVYTQVYSQT